MGDAEGQDELAKRDLDSRIAPIDRVTIDRSGRLINLELGNADVEFLRYLLQVREGIGNGF
jgi:hypothetical protein